MSDGITQVNDWHRLAMLQKQVRDLEVTVAKLEQQLSGKEPAPVAPSEPPKRTLLQRIFRKP